MKRLIVVLVLAGAAVWTAVALGTPSQGQTSSITSVGALQSDLAFNTGLAAEANGITWQGKQYSRRPVAGVPVSASNRRRDEPRRMARPPPGRVGQVRNDSDRAPALAGGRHAAGDLRARRSLRLAQPSRLPDRHRRVGTDRPLRDRLLRGDVHAGQTFYETAAQDVHDQEREQ